MWLKSHQLVFTVTSTTGKGCSRTNEQGQAGQSEKNWRTPCCPLKKEGPLSVKTFLWNTQGSSLQQGSLENEFQLQAEKQYFIYLPMLSCKKCLLQCVPIHCLSLKPTSCWSSSQFVVKEKLKPANSCFWVQSLYLRGQMGLTVTIWTGKKQQIPATNLLLYTGALWLQSQKDSSYKQCSKDGGRPL